MKIKRFTAATMREVIRRVREEQGPDAVILNQQRTDEGIDVVAAVDYDEALFRQALRAPVTATAEPAPVPMPRPGVVSGGLQQELGGLRQWLEEQFVQLFQTEFERTHPRRAAAARKLEELGIERSFAQTLATQGPDCGSEVEARKQCLDALMRSLLIPAQEPLDRGGVLALLGPTGAGKTTTVAKLAARYIAKHGIRSVALLTTDHYRVGAREQLFTYGRLLGVPVYAIGDADELNKTLQQLVDCPLVLVDTAGLSPRDCRITAQLQLLKGGARPIQTCLVLPATSQQCDLTRTVASYPAAAAGGVILTKTDETARLGGALSLLAQNRLPLSYLCNGQRVPEDLRRPQPAELLVDLIRQSRPTPAAESEPVFTLPLPLAAQEVLHAAH